MQILLPRAVQNFEVFGRPAFGPALANTDVRNYERADVDAGVDHGNDHAGDLLIDAEVRSRHGVSNEADPIVELLPCQTYFAVGIVSDLSVDEVREALLREIR